MLCLGRYNIFQYGEWCCQELRNGCVKRFSYHVGKREDRAVLNYLEQNKRLAIIINKNLC